MCFGKCQKERQALGEKIKVIGHLDNVEIELNHPQTSGGERIIHIQNSKGRFCVTESEFLQIAVAISKAGFIFKHNKNLEGT